MAFKWSKEIKVAIISGVFLLVAAMISGVFLLESQEKVEGGQGTENIGTGVISNQNGNGNVSVSGQVNGIINIYQGNNIVDRSILETSDVYGLYSIAKKHYDAKEWEEAVKYFTRVIEKDSMYYQAYIDRGVVFILKR